MAHPSPLALDVLKCDDECTALARCIFGEARGFPPTDDPAVAWTVVNRKNTPRRYGRTIQAVCGQRSQYSCFDDGSHLPAVLHPERAEPNAWRQAQTVAAAVLAGRIADPTGGATHYVAKWLYDSPKCPKWAKGKDVVAQVIGTHVFLKGRSL